MTEDKDIAAENAESMVRPHTVTLNAVQWNIVLMALSYIDEQIGDDCSYAEIVKKNLITQLKSSGWKG